MTPGKYNMVCPQGSTFDSELTYSIDDVPVDLTGYTARMQIRESHTSKTAKATLTTENSAITVSEDGTIHIVMSASQTGGMVAKQYVYDLELISPSNIVSRLLEGKFIVTPEVTR